MKESSVILLLTSLLPTITSLSCYSCSTFEVDPAVTTLDSQALRSNVVTRQTFQLISDSLQTDCESDGVSKVCPGESCIASHIRLESIEDDDGRMTLGTISLYECGAEWLEKDQKFCRSAENGISDPTLEAECYMSTCRDGDLCNIPNVLLKPLTTFSSNTVKPTEASSDMTNGETDRAETEGSTQDNGDIVIKEGEGENEEESRDGEIEDEGGSDSEMEIKETDNENETVDEESGTGDESGAVEDHEESVNQPTDGTSSTELDEENGNINETAEGMENSEIEETVIIGPEGETKSESVSETESERESETESESETEGQSENDGPDVEEDGDFNVKEESVNSSENEENSKTNSEFESATEEGSGNGIETEKELDNAGETESKGDSGKDSEGNSGSDAGGGCMRTFSAIGIVFTAAVLHVV